MTPREQAKAWAHSLIDRAFAEGATIQGIQFGSPVEADYYLAEAITKDAKAIIYKRTRESVLSVWWHDGE